MRCILYPAYLHDILILTTFGIDCDPVVQFIRIHNIVFNNFGDAPVNIERNEISHQGYLSDLLF